MMVFGKNLNLVKNDTFNLVKFDLVTISRFKYCVIEKYIFGSAMKSFSTYCISNNNFGGKCLKFGNFRAL